MCKLSLTNWERCFALLAATALTAFALAGCTSSPATPANMPTKQEARGTFIEGEVAGAEAETLNWILAADASSFAYVGYTVESLASYDNDFNVVLRCLAKDIEVSPDGLVYTITIRDDLRWSDNSPVTAEDYVYTLKNLMFSDWLNYNYREDWMEEVGGKKVFVTPAVVNQTTFTITRQTVQPEFIYTLYDLIPLSQIHLGQIRGRRGRSSHRPGSSMSFPIPATWGHINLRNG